MTTLLDTKIPASLGLTTNLAQTTHFMQGVMTAQAVIATNGIAAIEGVPGTGKTTTARYVAHTASRPCAIATMPNRPAPLDLLRHTHKAITGMPSGRRDTRFDMQNKLLQILTDWQGVLIVDELQNTEANAMQELVWLYEESQHAFGLIIVGSTVLTAVQKYPQLASRIMGKVIFKPILGKELLETVRQLDPRLAATPQNALVQHDDACARGLIRTWCKTVDWLNVLGIDEGPVSNEVFANIRAALPRW